jgi:hypothetical protein
MSRSQSPIRFLPKYGLRAFRAAKILAIPAALIFLRCGDSSGLVDPRRLEPAVRRVVLNGQVMKGRYRPRPHGQPGMEAAVALVSPQFDRSLQSEIEGCSVIGL